MNSFPLHNFTGTMSIIRCPIFHCSQAPVPIMHASANITAWKVETRRALLHVSREIQLIIECGRLMIAIQCIDPRRLVVSNGASNQLELPGFYFLWWCFFLPRQGLQHLPPTSTEQGTCHHYCHKWGWKTQHTISRKKLKAQTSENQLMAFVSWRLFFFAGAF